MVNPYYGGHSGEVTPVPIPNTEVKLSSADGTARGTVWESRSPPVTKKRPRFNRSGGVFFGGGGAVYRRVR